MYTQNNIFWCLFRVATKEWRRCNYEILLSSCCAHYIFGYIIWNSVVYVCFCHRSVVTVRKAIVYVYLNVVYMDCVFTFCYLFGLLSILCVRHHDACRKTGVLVVEQVNMILQQIICVITICSAVQAGFDNFLLKYLIYYDDYWIYPVTSLCHLWYFTFWFYLVF
jgi:hypothetical protein